MEDQHEGSRKHVKMPDLASVLRFEETTGFHHPKFSKDKGVGVRCHFGEEEMSHLTEVPIKIKKLSEVQTERAVKDTSALLVDHASKPLVLNANNCNADNLTCGNSETCGNDTNKLLMPMKNNRGLDVNLASLRGTGLDLNVEDISSPVSLDPFYLHKNREHLKRGDASECGSSTGSLEEKDSLKIWRQMKQNGFLSSSHGGIPVPRQRGRKSKNELLKRRIEAAKKEQVDRFAKIAAPSGLLNGLNPGIINHVRNSKQVHSIIEALVRSEKNDALHASSKHVHQSKGRIKESEKKDMENVKDGGVQRINISHEDVPHNSLLKSRHAVTYPMSVTEPTSLGLDEKGRVDQSHVLDRRISSDLHHAFDNDDDILALKLSTATTKASDIASSLSNDENISNATSLTVNAAMVASQWLELLHQDIRGRLAALRRSKKRVRAVINTELPFLLSKEFSSNQENNLYASKVPAGGRSDNTAADMHQARWMALFDQMDKALCEEEKQLESWLSQVREMHLECEKGLHQVHLLSQPWFQPPGTSESDPRSEILEKGDRVLSIRAAAASIYSTCNFLLSMENVSCF